MSSLNVRFKEGHFFFIRSFSRCLHVCFFLCHLNLTRHSLLFHHGFQAFIFLDESLDLFIELESYRLYNFDGVVMDILDLPFEFFVHILKHFNLGFDFFVSLFDPGIGWRQLEVDFLTGDHMFVNIKNYNKKEMKKI